MKSTGWALCTRTRQPWSTIYVASIRNAKCLPLVRRRGSPHWSKSVVFFCPVASQIFDLHVLLMESIQIHPFKGVQRIVIIGKRIHKNWRSVPLLSPLANHTAREPTSQGQTDFATLSIDVQYLHKEDLWTPSHLRDSRAGSETKPQQ